MSPSGVPRTRIVTSESSDEPPKQFEVLCRIDTPLELEYYRHGGILHCVLRQMLQSKPA